MTTEAELRQQLADTQAELAQWKQELARVIAENAFEVARFKDDLREAHALAEKLIIVRKTLERENATLRAAMQSPPQR